MARIYSATNRIRFTDIPEKYAVPRSFRAKQCEMHSAVVTYVYDHFYNTKKYRQKVTDALNSLTYCLLNNNPPPYKWNSTNPLETMPDDIDLDEVEKGLGEIFLTEDAIIWDVTPLDIESMPKFEESSNNDSRETVPESTQHPVKKSKPSTKPSKQISATNVDKVSVSVTKPSPKNRPLKAVRSQTEQTSDATPTPKEDLYIQPPKYPRFDYNKVWLSRADGGDQLVIYTTLPEIPTKQNEISVTTDVESMTLSELMNLYPNHIIHTRSPKMYEKQPGIDFDDDLGCVFPIEGFTRAQIIDNIICYPHLFRLKKLDNNGELANFYATIEIDGQLIPIGEAWDMLPESKVIPRDSEFVKEYVVRRYLLEEAAGMDHKYKLFGTLDPFLTLFMPPAEYINRGYKDTTEIVKQCVRSRIRYKQSRNPILRRLNQNV